MALLFFETFNKYATGATGWTDLTNDNPDYTMGGASGPVVTGSQGRNGEQVLSYGVVAGRDITVPFASVASGNTVIMSALVRIGSTGGLSQTRMQLFGGYTTAGGVTQNFRVSVTRTGQLVVDDPSGTQVAFSDAVMAADHWHVVEVKCLMENAGTIEVRVDGATVINYSGDFLTGTGPRGYVRLFDGLDTCDVQWFAVMDASGSYMNNFLGDLAISEVVPDADGATAAAWTASAGSNYQCVDDALGAYNDDTDYISSSTTNQDNYVSMNGVTLTGLNTVKFAYHTALARNDGSGSIALLTENNATVSASADKTLTTSYAWKRKVDYLDPNTAAVWADAAAIDAAEWGVRYR